MLMEPGTVENSQCIFFSNALPHAIIDLQITIEYRLV